MSIKRIIKDTLGFFYYNLYKKYSNVSGNRSLIYHAFGSKLEHDTYGISIDIKKFEEHMVFLNDNYKVIHSHNSLKNESKSISITIDDGYKDTLDAIEILNNYNMPFSLFITTNFINKKNYLSESDIIQISDLHNAEIGSHGCKHRKLGDLSLTDQVYEISQSKKYLETTINKEIIGISYPHGSYNNDTFGILKKYNYKYALSSVKGINNLSSNKYLIKRNEIINSDNIKSLRKKIQGFYDYY